MISRLPRTTTGPRPLPGSSVAGDEYEDTGSKEPVSYLRIQLIRIRFDRILLGSPFLKMEWRFGGLHEPVWRLPRREYVSRK